MCCILCSGPGLFCFAADRLCNLLWSESTDQKHGKVIDHGMFHLSENARTCSFGSTGWVRLSDTTSIVALSPLPTSPAFTQLTPTQVAHSSLHMDSASEGLQRTGMGMHVCQFFLPNLSASQSGPCVMWKSTCTC